MSGRSKSALTDAIDVLLGRFLRREPKQSRSRALVDAIVEATDDLLRRGESGDDLTVEQVSERAGIGIGSFYEYFAGKDNVLGVLIGKETRRNFEELSRKLDALESDSLRGVIGGFARCIVDTYLAHPNRTRVIVEAVGRLGLASLLHDEKDRFARVLAVRASRFLPGESLDALTTTMRRVADAVIGVVVFNAMRGAKLDRADIAEDLAALAIAIVERRHPVT